MWLPVKQVETAYIFGFYTEMLEGSAKDSSGGLAYNSKPYVVVLKPLKKMFPSGIHLELWNERVDLLPIDGFGLLEISCNSSTEEGFIEVCDETFDLCVVLCLVHVCICFGVHFSYTLKSGLRYAET